MLLLADSAAGNSVAPWIYYVAVAAALIVLILVIVLIVRAVKGSKKRKKESKAEAPAVAHGAVIEEPKPEYTPAPQKAELKAEEKPEPIKSKAEEPVKEEQVKAEEKPVEKAPVKTQTKPAASKTAAPKPAAQSQAKAPAKKPIKPIEYKADKQPSKVYHISKRKSDGMWQIKAAGANKAIKLFKTQKEAIDYCKPLAENQDANVMIHKEDGSFRKLTY